MPFEFIQIPANGQGSAKEELNKLLRKQFSALRVDAAGMGRTSGVTPPSDEPSLLAADGAEIGIVRV